MIRTILTLLAIFFISPTAFSQDKDQNLINQAADKVKLEQAKQEFYKGDYVKALNLYKEVLNNQPNNASVMFHIGEVYFAMKLYEDAQETLEKANSIDPKAHEDLPYYLGRSYHVNGDMDKALEFYTNFKSAVSEGKQKEYEINKLIAECNTAKEMMKSPGNVIVSNAGDMINSSYDDKAPCITADGKTFVFTSRRPQGKSGQKVDKEGDFKYFDDIYICSWDPSKSTWSEADLIKGSVNTEAHDACVSISPDGKQIFIYKNNETDARGGEIFVSKVQSSGKWGAPKNIGKPVSTSYVENGACLSPDGNTLYFVSETPRFKKQMDKEKDHNQSKTGGGDIWMVKKISKSEWGIPENLGPLVNSPFDEGGIFLHPDGKTLFFASDREGGMGGYDIYMTRLENGKWSKPVNLGYPINSTRDDKCFILTTDNKTAYFDSDRAGGLGERDVYRADVSGFALINPAKTEEGPKLSILKGTVYYSDSANLAEGVKVTIKEKESGAEAGTTTTGSDGTYFITLMGDKKYIIEVEVKGYVKVAEEFMLPSDKKETFTLVKHIILNKDKK
ncbi:MAG: tetratricopeptide repeat protein [Bacteroidota bacterium]